MFETWTIFYDNFPSSLQVPYYIKFYATPCFCKFYFAILKKSRNLRDAKNRCCEHTFYIKLPRKKYKIFAKSRNMRASKSRNERVAKISYNKVAPHFSLISRASDPEVEGARESALRITFFSRASERIGSHNESSCQWSRSARAPASPSNCCR